MLQLQVARWSPFGLGVSTFLFATLMGGEILGQTAPEHLIPSVPRQNTEYFQLKDHSIPQTTLRFQDSSRRNAVSPGTPVAPHARPAIAKSAQTPVVRLSRGANSSRVSLAIGTSESKNSDLVKVGFLQQDFELGAQDQEEDQRDPEAQDPDAETNESETDEAEADDGETDQDRQPRSREVNQTWVRKSIRAVRTDIRELKPVAPKDRSAELDYGMGDWNQFQAAPKTFAWYAPDIRYQPLFFEDVALERYGQTLGFHRQTIRSGCHFFKSAVTFPNKMRHDSPWSCDYPLGFCRPGTCVPGVEQKQYLGRPY